MLACSIGTRLQCPALGELGRQRPYYLIPLSDYDAAGRRWGRCAGRCKRICPLVQCGCLWGRSARLPALPCGASAVPLSAVRATCILAMHHLLGSGACTQRRYTWAEGRQTRCTAAGRQAAARVGHPVQRGAWRSVLGLRAHAAGAQLDSPVGACAGGRAGAAQACAGRAEGSPLLAALTRCNSSRIVAAPDRDAPLVQLPPSTPASTVPSTVPAAGRGGPACAHGYSLRT